jgi:hypothetical protein
MFGLDLRAAGDLPSFPVGTAAPTGRRLELSFEPQGSPRLGFPEGGRAISEEREGDGEPVFRIESDEEAGYLIWGPRYGANLLRPDARSVLSRPGEGGFAAWLRLLVAQLLPFAAILRGLEALHASAVLAGGQAVLIAGRSGAGKSATAEALCRGGASFLADDVVALEIRDGALIAHPGAPLRTAPGSREELVPVGPTADAAELGALFFLDRRGDGPAEPRFDPAVDPRLLLSSTFNTVLASPARLRSQLEVCAAIGERRVERVTAGPGVDPDRIAEAIAERAARRR